MTKTQQNSVISVLFSKPFLGIILLFTLVSLLNIPVLITLWRHGFDDGTYSHAFLIPFISLYLYFLLAEMGKLQFRKKLAIAPTVLLVISCYLLFVTANAQISVGYWGALLAVFITSVTMLYRFNWYIVFPAAFLVFIFPFWGVLVPLLQNVSVAAVTYMMTFTGVPTYVEAEMITIPAGVFEIADGCSGLRYMIVSLAIGSLFIFLNIRDTKKAALFLSLTILGALLTNWIRITALILIGEYTNMESSLMDDHNTFGWYLYVPFMILLFYFGNKLTTINPIKEYAIVSQAAVIDNKIILFIIFPLLISATSFQLIPDAPQDPSLALKNINQHLQPRIYFYTSIEKHNPNKNNFSLVYHFNGADLDGKATFYKNELIPFGWKVLEQKTINNERTLIITKNKKKALLSINYSINKTKYATKGAFKLARLKHALSGNNKSELHWKLQHCIYECINK